MYSNPHLQTRPEDILTLSDVKTYYYLDTRYAKKDGSHPLKLRVTVKSLVALANVGVDLQKNEWDGDKVVKRKDSRVLNMVLRAHQSSVDMFLLDACKTQSLADIKTSKDLKTVTENVIAGRNPFEGLTPTDVFAPYLDDTIESLTKPGTKRAYKYTRDVLKQMLPGYRSMTFSDITPQVLRKLEDKMADSGMAVNTISIHMRNIRAVFNRAIDDEITNCYPFRKYKIKTEKTRKRSLSVEALREYFDAPVTEDQQLHLDMFKLIFYLIGINLADLSELTTIEDGRVNYKRAKTGQLYSIKVEPEALEIINKYRGEDKLLSVFERWNVNNYMRRLNKTLKKIGHTEIGKQGKRTFHPLQPQLSSYWARHTWASIAADLDIPIETISYALGHSVGGGAFATSEIYIKYNIKKVDRANRKVLDWVLYGKKSSSEEQDD